MFCPLSSSFFSKFKYSHSSHIRREVNKVWQKDRKTIKNHIRKLINKEGKIKLISKQTIDWMGAFRYSEERNKYRGYRMDAATFTADIESQRRVVLEGTIILDEPTLCSLASLSFQQDMDKESPNPFFLKELFRLYIQRLYPVAHLEEEKSLRLFGEPVRLDVCCSIPDNVGEAGGVQLWKVMALLHYGYEVYVFPHWTTNKTNPFMRKKLQFTFFHFKNGLSDVPK
ncbi:hypothetical protein [Brevibacillus laterosporus]|uniref:hypothetical protein n=1 Tax=Brevibacillus laterosporus TaxID=1465 RepID=UPI0014449459|nr:hypothetical protein [Brevibacillus laterosporus]NKQ22757.1 hypothetical protein [Brevibacillus laterosporus]WNX29211.1 hypothetical protein RWW94_13210 [Brevibacillus laterosporus]